LSELKETLLKKLNNENPMKTFKISIELQNEIEKAGFPGTISNCTVGHVRNWLEEN